MDKRTIKKLQNFTVDTEVKNVIEKRQDDDMNMCLKHHDTFRISSINGFESDTLELYVYDKKEENYIRYWTKEQGLIKDYEITF